MDDDEKKPGMDSAISERDLLESKLLLGGIEVRGCARTRPAFVRRVLEQCLCAAHQQVAAAATARDASKGGAILADDAGFGDGKSFERGTLESTLLGLSEALEVLEATQAFKGVDIFLDRSSAAAFSADHEIVDATITISERDSLFQVQSQVESSTKLDEAMMSASASARNLFGNAESLSVKMGFGTKNVKKKATTSFDVVLTKPCIYHVENTATFRAFSRMLNLEDRSSYSMKVRGMELELASRFGTTTLGAEVRDMHALSEGASLSIREDAGISIKSSIRHAWTKDARDDPVFPTEGHLLAAELELAGLGMGDVSHLRTDVGAQYHVSVGPIPDTTLSGVGKAGVVVPLSPLGKTKVHDRFFLGGPQSFRGFRTKGVGPHDGKDALGGDMYYTLMAMLSIPVPQENVLRRWIDSKLHLFVTMGDIITYEQGGDRLRGRTSPFSSTRISAGVGLVAALPFGRFELNVCHVFRRAEADRIKSGIQVGLSQSI
ncbi:SAM50-like protein SPAC17C9.06 [Porphyridium purpureum]|uniref:SAM50-like protein SPAC17C9.06 n=1 Tax=Porphyridium purpureum TaxID=35688 RepID=A0A5J4YRF9_PORPP|nr:SAM50-like protein SPAC17C9.06 [Porphyridium purpureum]|eukprot:POR1614..scf236_6